jgi:type IV pilus assembly protein PilW
MLHIISKKEGFTLSELLVAMVISAVVMAAIYSTYYSQQRSYLVQEQVAAMQQNLRAAMFYMEKEIRMAGCDPTRAADAGITTANADSISFTEDITGGPLALLTGIPATPMRT